MEDTAHGPVRYLPHAVAATATVTLAPAALVWIVATTGMVTGFAALLAIGLVVSLLVAYAGQVLWQLRRGSRDLLFSDLMLWGWVRRWRQEGHLDDAIALLGLGAEGAAEERSEELEPEARIKALKRLATALEARDPYTHGHSRRVARYSAMIAKKLDVPAAEVAKIRLAAAVHDVGKLVVPLTILNKPGKLTDEEFAVIKRHAPVGAEMVSRVGDDELTRIVAHHHERLDGSGYPSRLSGSEIPLGARIVAVADTFDALTSTRAYRPAKRHRDVFRILREEAGTQLDPLAVQAFCSAYSGFKGIAAWSIVSGAPQRLLFPLGGHAPVAGGTLTAKALAVLATAVATGGIVKGPALNDPRDTSASPTGLPAIAAIGTAAQGAGSPAPERKSAEVPARGAKPGDAPSKASAGIHAEEDANRGSAPGQGDEPSGGDGPGPSPDPGSLPGADPPPIPRDPTSGPRQVVERRLDRVGDKSGQLPQQARELAGQPGQPGQLGELG